MRAEPLGVRFWRKVDKTDGCWLWTGSSDSSGYGHIKIGRVLYSAHRVAWFMATGSWPVPCALHKCDTPACVRKDHLFEGTKADNVADMDRKGRRNVVQGEQHPHSRLTSEQIRNIRERSAAGETRASLARGFGLTPSAVSKIVLGQSRRVA